jgi:DNA-binding transcriptional LysR family regulator
MDTLKSLQVFKAIVEKGSFTKASEQLNMSLAMTSKHLQHLENHVQAKLLHRNNRNLSLTEVGQQYYAEAIQALELLQDAKSKAQAGSILPEGKLRLVAPLWFATPYFVQLLADFQQLYPKIQLSVDLENRFTDLIAEGYDLALRVVNTPQDNLIVKPLGQIDFYYVASPQFLQQHGTPKHVDELSAYSGILPNYTVMDTPLTKFNDSNNTTMVAQMVMAGMGVGILPEWLIHDAVADGRLVHLWAQKHSSVHLYAVYMNRAFLNSKIRLLMDFLAKRL